LISTLPFAFDTLDRKHCAGSHQGLGHLAFDPWYPKSGCSKSFACSDNLKEAFFSSKEQEHGKRRRSIFFIVKRRKGEKEKRRKV
jgi:hypothetical protein